MNNKIILLTTALLAACAGQTLAQDSAGEAQSFSVPLTNPGQPVELEVDLTSGAIRVIGEDREDVSFTVSARGESKRRIVTPSGSRPIPISSFGLNVEEQDNRIEVDSDYRSGSMQLEIHVPRNAQLELGTVHNGVVEVENVTGELVLSNVHGPITAIGIRGNVIAETVHGEVRIELLETTDKPMAFSTVHGDLDISFPERFGAELHIVTRQDEIISDFEVEVVPTDPKISRREDDKRYSVELGQEIVALINGGGPKVRFDTLHGNVIIRKSGGG
jgi:hypothetical protein